MERKGGITGPSWFVGVVRFSKRGLVTITAARSLQPWLLYVYRMMVTKLISGQLRSTRVNLGIPKPQQPIQTAHSVTRHEARRICHDTAFERMCAVRRAILYGT